MGNLDLHLAIKHMYLKEPRTRFPHRGELIFVIKAFDAFSESTIHLNTQSILSILYRSDSEHL